MRGHFPLISLDLLVCCGTCYLFILFIYYMLFNYYIMLSTSYCYQLRYVDRKVYECRIVLADSPTEMFELPSRSHSQTSTNREGARSSASRALRLISPFSCEVVRHADSEHPLTAAIPGARARLPRTASSFCGSARSGVARTARSPLPPPPPAVPAGVV